MLNYIMIATLNSWIQSAICSWKQVRIPKRWWTHRCCPNICTEMGCI